MQPATKAAAACALFGAVALFAYASAPRGGAAALLAAYYVILLVNTFFSIRTFAAITPPDSTQACFDAVLAATYCALAFSFGSVAQFSLVAGTLFSLSIGKYAHLARLVPYPRFLALKMKINALGALLALGSWALARLGFPLLAAWGLCGIFAIANVYLLAIKPMYRLEA